MAVTKNATEQPSRRTRGETPIPRITPCRIATLRNPWKGRQHDAAVLQHTVNGANCRARIKYQLQRLTQNEAVKSIRWNLRGAREIGDNRRLRIFRHMKDITHVHAVSTKAPGVLVVANFQHAPRDRGGLVM